METILLKATVLEALTLATMSGACDLELKPVPLDTNYYWTFLVKMKNHTLAVITENVHLPKVWEIDDKLKHAINQGG